ncbi:MAG: dihydrofolate reductase family protein [Solirubrobacterales bacterium]|nr:dihydrofolate reductase family protein [Solirubrobacterales bacterium]
MRALSEGSGSVSAEEAVAALGLSEGGRPGLPRVVAIMVASIDGRATVDERSGGLGHPEDRALLRGLRAAADCVLVGTGTIAAEKYANLLDADQREARQAAGRTPHPILATLSRRGEFPWEVPVLGEEGVPKQLYSEREVELPANATETSLHVSDGGLRGALEHLHGERGVLSVACEGGPGVLRALLADDLVDDLLLTLAPLVVAGDGPTSLAGAALDPPAELRLAGVRRADDHLFLHYAR